ncbi:MAG: hypothetical protein QF609_09600, partial [Gammaproteobacteria bacterium]|nr:hypothetical protein [Gammaproteobacteria bacterium]
MASEIYIVRFGDAERAPQNASFYAIARRHWVGGPPTRVRENLQPLVPFLKDHGNRLESPVAI